MKKKTSWRRDSIRKAEKNKLKYLVGIDEVGRGPLAGPVAVGVVKIPVESLGRLLLLKDFIPANHDSKKLKEIDRERYSLLIKKLAKIYGIDYAIIFGSNTEIDKKGISFCIRKCLRSGLKKVKSQPKESLVLLDGGLRAPAEFIFQETIIKGDEKELVISMASILAKVARDTLMKRCHLKYPVYGFKDHKGYGTKKHLQAISKCGLCPLHRQSFCKRFIK